MPIELLTWYLFRIGSLTADRPPQDAASTAWEESNSDIVELWTRFLGPKVIEQTSSAQLDSVRVVDREPAALTPAAAMAARRREANLKKAARAAKSRAKKRGSASSSTSDDSSDESLEHSVDWCMQELTL